MQAAAGIISVTGEADRPGVRVGVSMIDQTTGMWAAIGILARALGARPDAGRAAWSTSRCTSRRSAWSPTTSSGYLGSGAVPGRHGTAFPLIAPYEAFAASDGEIMILAANDHLFAQLCEAHRRAASSPPTRASPRTPTAWRTGTS